MKGKAEIREFVRGLLTGSGDDEPLADDDSLLNGGRLQSIDAVEIVVFLEENFGIDFAQIGFDKDQIDSVDAIYALTRTAGISSSG
jgi:acyl carrier protein